MIRNFLTMRYNPINPPITPARWQNFTNKVTDPEGDITERLLIQSISNLELKKENKIIISLSSGIDSSLCLALLRKVFHDKEIIAINGMFSKNFDESERAKDIATKFQAKFKVVKIDSIFTRMPELVSITGKPRWNTYQYIIASEAAKYGNVLVTGDGADEIFAGYTFRYHKFLGMIKHNNNWKIKTKAYLECHNRDWVPDQKNMFGKAIKFSWDNIYRYFKSYFSNKLSDLEQLMLADFNGKLLYDFMPTGRSICKFYGIRGAPIFLDASVIKFGLKIPMIQKYDDKNQQGKIILRKIAKRLGVEHINDKKGFSPDIIIDWETHGKKISEYYLLNESSHIYANKLINYDWVLKAFEKVEDDGDIRYLNRLISILGLEIWYRIFISKEMKASQKLS